MAIDPLTSISSAVGPAAPAASDANGAPGFGSALDTMLKAVDGTNDAANDAVGKMLDGTGDVHDAMIALQRADMTFQLAVQIRNKIVQAYQDVMRMPA